MANALFTEGKHTFLGNGTQIALDVDNTRIVFVDHADDTPVPATDQWLSDIMAAARVGTSGNLAGATITGGAFDTNDVVVATVTGDQFESVVLYKETGVEGTSNLIGFYDTATGLPFSPSGGNVTVVIHGSGWFSL